MLEMSSEIVPDSIISFWSRRESLRNDVLNLLGRTERQRLTPEVEIESCPYYRRAFPFWNDVPVLLLNHSNDTFATTNSFQKQFSAGKQSDLKVRKETITELLIGFC